MCICCFQLHQIRECGLSNKLVVECGVFLACKDFRGLGVEMGGFDEPFPACALYYKKVEIR